MLERVADVMGEMGPPPLWPVDVAVVVVAAAAVVKFNIKDEGGVWVLVLVAGIVVVVSGDDNDVVARPQILPLLPLPLFMSFAELATALRLKLLATFVVAVVIVIF